MEKHAILTEIKRTRRSKWRSAARRARFSQDKRDEGLQTGEGRTGSVAAMQFATPDFSSNKLQAAYNEELLIEKFIGLARDLGHFPVATEVKMKAGAITAFPWHKLTFARFGSKQQFAARILNFCKDRAGYDDIVALCATIAVPTGHQLSEDSACDLTAAPSGSTRRLCVHGTAKARAGKTQDWRSHLSSAGRIRFPYSFQRPLSWFMPLGQTMLTG